MPSSLRALAKGRCPATLSSRASALPIPVEQPVTRTTCELGGAMSVVIEVRPAALHAAALGRLRSAAAPARYHKPPLRSESGAHLR